MTEEEKEAIESLKTLLYADNLTQRGKRKLIEIYENLIQKQQTEIEKARNTKSLYYENKELRKELKNKDKIIDEMTEEYEYNARVNVKDFCEDEMRRDSCIQDCKTCIKHYFEKKVEESNI